MIEIYRQPDIDDLIGIARVMRPTQVKIPFAYGKPVKSFDFKIQNNGMIRLEKSLKDTWESLPFELSDEEIQEYELKCIYCQLFINKYLRAK